MNASTELECESIEDFLTRREARFFSLYHMRVRTGQPPAPVALPEVSQNQPLPHHRHGQQRDIVFSHDRTLLGTLHFWTELIHPQKVVSV